ncbi:MAG: hypothetical protein HKN68_02580, partial [Saprospiraceae bacterium]|nr:hypothetical protein [Saprospiraceae bacterium]
NYYQWITPDNLSMLGYIVDEKILVLINASENGEIFSKIKIPDGKWALIGSNEFIDHTLEYDPDNPDHGEGGVENIFVSPKSFKMWVKM